MDATANGSQKQRQKTQFTKDGHLALKMPSTQKIEAQVMGGIAVNKQKHEVLKAALVMDYPRLNVSAGDLAILKGDSGFKAWARDVLVVDGQEFVLCPETDVIGFEQLF